MRLNRRGRVTGSSRSRIWLAVGLLLTVALIAFGLSPGARLARTSGVNPPHPPALAAASTSALSAQRVRAAFSHLPLIFESNQGQSDRRVKFLARGSGYGLFLTGHEAVLSLQAGRPQDNRPSAGSTVVRMALAGANSKAAVTGAELLPGKSNYFIGNNPAKWHRNIPQFARVRYREVYPGIDLVYYGSQGRLEYDFEVAPNADPGQIALRFQGPERLTLQPDGDLLLATSSGDVRLQAPRVYQRFGDGQRQVSGRFVLRAKNEAGFELGAYDHGRALIIDPVLTYASYLGGSADEACSAIIGVVTPGCPAVAVDSALNVYIAGSTTSADFPIVPMDTCPPTNSPAAFQCALAGTANIFVTKFVPSSSPPYAFAFSTYLGGDGIDTSAGVAVDSGFNVDVAGTTSSTNFPTMNAFQAPPVSAGNHVFVSRLSSDGSTLLYSTYLAGSGVDTATGLAVDFKSKIYVTGTTTSPAFPIGDFPTTNGAFQTSPKAVNQFFFSKLDPTLIGAASLLYSSYLGGSTPSTGVTVGGGIAVDAVSPNPNVYITGGTDFTDMPLLNAFQSTVGGGTDAFIGKFAPANATGAQELYLTYFGGDGDDQGNAIAVDATGNAYITGSTASVTGITPPSGITPFQPANAGGIDAFVTKFGIPCTGSSCQTTAVPLTYFTYLGGTGTDIGLGIAADATQGARIAGSTDSPDFHTKNPFQGAPGGLLDGFVARIDTTDTTGTGVGHYSSYFGGSNNDAATGIAIDSQSASYVGAETFSGDFPTVNPLQAMLNGNSDAFISKISPLVNLAFSPAPTASPNPVGVGSQVTYKYTIVNNGDQTTGVTFTDFLPATGATFVSASLSSPPNACGTAVGGLVVCNIGNLNSGQTTTASVILVPTSAGDLSNSAQLAVAGSNIITTGSASTTVNDFAISAAPASFTVVAGAPATYMITVNTIPQNSAIPASVSLSCSSGLPPASSCSFTTNPIPNLLTGSATSTLNLNTTMRTTTTVDLRPGGGPLYAAWLPVSGLTLLGLGIGGKMSRKRRLLGGLLLTALFALALFQAGCGSSGKSSTTTLGTPAGDYIVTLTATSGSATRTTSVLLTVQ
ncbi:MAG TPA: SBBP repeat-containing protein [Terriglobales bacterium]|nr:SBBP repeat-containing protein [Terriglobales bacterium]